MRLPILAALALLAPSPGDTPVEIASVDLSPAYPYDPGKDFEKAYPPEIEAEKDSVKWKRDVPLDDQGAVDLADLLGNPVNVVVYARVFLEAAAPAKLRLSMGSDDGLTVFVNGRKIHAKNASRGLKRGEDQAEADLVKGRNTLLFRVTQGSGGFGLQVEAAAAGAVRVEQARGDAAAKAFIRFELDAEASTTGGIFDAEGKLVRVLWKLKKLPAGKHERGWDGLDDLDRPLPPGDYRWKVVANRAVYRNVGAVGNSGLPPTAKAHTPTHMHDVAVDAEGAVYTVNYWDEAGADFKKWDKDGNSVYDAQYQMRNGNPNGAPYACAVDDRYLYCAMEGWPGEPWKNRQQVQRFRLADGKHEKFTEVGREDGHINVYEEPKKLIPPDASKEDAELMHWPLRDLEVRGESLLVADTLGGRVLRFHKVTGKPEGEFKVKFPTAIAVDSAGKIWVGHERRKVSVFADGGKLEREVLGDLGTVKALAFGPDGRLYVADAGAGQVKVYDVSGAAAKPVRTLGQKAVPGDRAADRFFDLRGVAVDRQGFVATAQNEPMGGARVARWTPEGKLLWEHFGTVFVSLANYGAHDPDTLYSMHFHRYRLKDRDKGAWEYAGNVYGGEGKGYCSDVHGVLRILKNKAGAEHVYTPTGDGVSVWRVTPRGLRLAALLGGRDPDPAGVRESDGKKLGRWAWTSPDREGGLPKPEEVRWFRKPGEKDAPYAVFGMDVDREGNVWFGELHTRAIWTIPCGEPNAAGNPVYDWANARVFAPRDESPLKFEPNMVQRAEDGSVYAFGWSAAWPSPKNNPFWMGGTTLARFDAKGRRLWAAKLPDVCVGLDVIPGGAGGCMAGSGRAAAIYHFTADGLHVGTFKPGEAMGNESGWMDNHASVAVNRDPRDGVLDVFAEDDYVLRIGWYRLDDRPIRTLAGAVKLP